MPLNVISSRLVNNFHLWQNVNDCGLHTLSGKLKGLHHYPILADAFRLLTLADGAPSGTLHQLCHLSIGVPHLSLLYSTSHSLLSLAAPVF